MFNLHFSSSNDYYSCCSLFLLYCFILSYYVVNHHFANVMYINLMCLILMLYLIYKHIEYLCVETIIEQLMLLFCELVQSFVNINQKANKLSWYPVFLATYLQRTLYHRDDNESIKLRSYLPSYFLVMNVNAIMKSLLYHIERSLTPR